MLQARVRTNAKSVSAQLKNLIPALDVEIDIGMRAGAELLRENIRKHASGRPGPNIGTGDDPRHPGHYRDSWKIRRIGSRAAATAGATTSYSVFMTHPAAASLEYGFHGFDSIGRAQNRPAYPHIQPAIEETAAVLAATVARSMNRSGSKIYGPLGAAGGVLGINTDEL